MYHQPHREVHVCNDTVYYQVSQTQFVWTQRESYKAITFKYVLLYSERTNLDSGVLK